MVLTLSEMAAKWRLSEPGKGLVTACSVCLPFFSLAGLLEPNTAASSSDTLDLPKEEGSDEVLTPTKPRTTEDLFAAIHRYPQLLRYFNILYNFFFLDGPLCFLEVFVCQLDTFF